MRQRAIGGLSVTDRSTGLLRTAIGIRSGEPSTLRDLIGRKFALKRHIVWVDNERWPVRCRLIDAIFFAIFDLRPNIEGLKSNGAISPDRVVSLVSKSRRGDAKAMRRIVPHVERMFDKYILFQETAAGTTNLTQKERLSRRSHPLVPSIIYISHWKNS
jgi:hypothetical protein